MYVHCTYVDGSKSNLVVSGNDTSTLTDVATSEMQRGKLFECDLHIVYELHKYMYLSSFFFSFIHNSSVLIGYLFISKIPVYHAPSILISQLPC